MGTIQITICNFSWQQFRADSSFCVLVTPYFRMVQRKAEWVMTTTRMSCSDNRWLLHVVVCEMKSPVQASSVTFRVSSGVPSGPCSPQRKLSRRGNRTEDTEFCHFCFNIRGIGCLSRDANNGRGATIFAKPRSFVFPSFQSQMLGVEV